MGPTRASPGRRCSSCRAAAVSVGSRVRTGRSSPAPKPGGPRSPGPPGPAGAGRPRAPARRACAARPASNAANVRRSSGSTSVNASAGTPASHPSTSAEQPLVVHQQHAAAGEEALDPAGRVAGRRARRQREPHQPRGLARPVEPPLVQQQPRGARRAAGRVRVVPLGDVRSTPAQRSRSAPAPPTASGGVRGGRRSVRAAGARCTASTWRAHRAGRVGVQADAGGREADADPLGEPGGDLGERGGVRAAHVAVAHARGPGRAAPPRGGRRPRPARPGRRGPASPRAARPAGRPAGSARRAPVTSASAAGAHGGVLRALAVAAARTVVPQTPASATRTASSGSHRSRQVSRKVPVPPRRAAGSPHPTSQQPQPVQQAAAGGVGVLAQVELQLPLQRLRLQPQARAARGPGRGRAAPRARPAGTSPSTSPTTSRSWISASGTSEPSHITARDRVGGLAEPGQRPAAQRGQRLGQPHRLDDVRGGDRAGPPRAAARRPSSSSGSTGRSGAVNRWRYQPGRVDARAVAAGPGQPAVRPGHPGRSSTLTLGSPLSSARSAAAVAFAAERRHVPGAADHGDRASYSRRRLPVSAAACGPRAPASWSCPPSP